MKVSNEELEELKDSLFKTSFLAHRLSKKFNNEKIETLIDRLQGAIAYLGMYSFTVIADRVEHEDKAGD